MKWKKLPRRDRIFGVMKLDTYLFADVKINIYMIFLVFAYHAGIRLIDIEKPEVILVIIYIYLCVSIVQ